MGFFDKFLNKFTNRASDKLADKAVNKIFGKDKKAQKDDVVEEKTQSCKNEQVNQEAQTTKTETVKVPTIDPAQAAMMSAMAGQGMVQANEILKYLILDDNMEVVGVKDDAPDYLKVAYKNGKLNNKD